MARGDAIELVDSVPAGNTLGEGILWDGVRAWWTNIQERRLFRYDPKTRKTKSFVLPKRLGSFGLVENSDKIVAAFESGFAFFHPETGACEWIARPPHEAVNIRFNDGRVDRQGRFWAGSMVEGEGAPRGKLYRLEHGKTPDGAFPDDSEWLVETERIELPTHQPVQSNQVSKLVCRQPIAQRLEDRTGLQRMRTESPRRRTTDLWKRFVGRGDKWIEIRAWSLRRPI